MGWPGSFVSCGVGWMLEWPWSPEAGLRAQPGPSGLLGLLCGICIPGGKKCLLPNQLRARPRIDPASLLSYFSGLSSNRFIPESVWGREYPEVSFVTVITKMPVYHTVCSLATQADKIANPHPRPSQVSLHWYISLSPGPHHLNWVKVHIRPFQYS